MEMTKVEVAAVQNAAQQVEVAVKTLDELELSLVGGGMGDIVL